MLIRHSLWCGREDSNLHRIIPTSPSSWRVYHSATTAIKLFMAHHNEINGAGEENRTLTVSLEGWSSTIKLHPLIRMVGKTGFEPATPWSQTRCSTKLSHFPFFKMAVQTGIEPAISCVTGRHVNRYTTGPFEWWPVRDSNPCMHAWKACVLNRFTNGPFPLIRLNYLNIFVVFCQILFLFLFFIYFRTLFGAF